MRCFPRSLHTGYDSINKGNRIFKQEAQEKQTKNNRVETREITILIHAINTSILSTTVTVVSIKRSCISIFASPSANYDLRPRRITNYRSASTIGHARFILHLYFSIANISKHGLSGEQKLNSSLAIFRINDEIDFDIDFVWNSTPFLWKEIWRSLSVSYVEKLKMVEMVVSCLSNNR